MKLHGCRFLYFFSVCDIRNKEYVCVCKQKKHEKKHEILGFKPLLQEIWLKNLTIRKIFWNSIRMIYSSWDVEQNILKLVVLGHFCPFTCLKPQKSKFWKIKKTLLEISLFYTCVPKATIIWYTVPQIWSEADRIFFHFGRFVALLPPPPPPPPTPNDPENQNFEKNEKNGDIILLYIHVCHEWRSYYIWFLK